MFGFRDVFDYLECSKCQCLQIVDVPPAMAKYYPDNYYAHTRVSPRKKLRNFFAKRRNKYALLSQGVIGRVLYAKLPHTALRSLARLRVGESTRILDVGCGAGSLLVSMGDLRFRNLLGVDPFIPADVQYQNGVTILKRVLHDVVGEFDVIMFHHAFEHISDPAPTLNTVHRLLAPGGYCVIRIPTVSSYAWHHYGADWVALDAPRHFFLHSLESTRVLAEEAGLELFDVVYDSTGFQFWGSEQYAHDIPLFDSRSYRVSPKTSMFSNQEIAMFEKRAAELNRARHGDTAAFYLRKPLG